MKPKAQLVSVGIIEKLGSQVKGFEEGQRVITGAITPSGHSAACQCGISSQDSAGTRHGWKPAGRVDLGAMVTHRFKLDDIKKTYDLFANQWDGVFKVAITP